jgi:hypothetical protein
MSPVYAGHKHICIRHCSHAFNNAAIQKSSRHAKKCSNRRLRKMRCRYFAGTRNMYPMTAAGGNTRIVSPRHKPARSISEFSIQDRQKGAAMRGTINRPNCARKYAPSHCRSQRAQDRSGATCLRKGCAEVQGGDQAALNDGGYAERLRLRRRIPSAPITPAPKIPNVIGSGTGANATPRIKVPLGASYNTLYCSASPTR